MDRRRGPGRAAAEAVELAGGWHNIPLIVLPGGRILVEPTDRELEDALASTSS